MERAEAEPGQGDVRGAESALVLRALSGSREAMAELVELVAPVIHLRVARYLAMRVPGVARADRDDLIQEVFVRLMAHDGRALRAWDPARGLDLVGFVALVAQREVVNVLKSGRRRPWGDASSLPSEDFGISQRESSEVGTIRRDLVRRLLGRLHEWLTPRGRELFQLVYMEERPLEDVAQKYGMKRSALYAWRNRVQNKARAIFSELDQHESA